MSHDVVLPFGCRSCVYTQRQPLGSALLLVCGIGGLLCWPVLCDIAVTMCVCVCAKGEQVDVVFGALGAVESDCCVSVHRDDIFCLALSLFTCIFRLIRLIAVMLSRSVGLVTQSFSVAINGVVWLILSVFATFL